MKSKVKIEAAHHPQRETIIKQRQYEERYLCQERMNEIIFVYFKGPHGEIEPFNFIDLSKA